MDRDTRKRKIQKDRQKKAKQTKVHTPRKVYDRRKKWEEIGEDDWVNPLDRMEDYE